MLFSSAIFLFGYLPLTLAIHAITPRRWRNIPLFLLSLLFYGWGELPHRTLPRVRPAPCKTLACAVGRTEPRRAGVFQIHQFYH